MVSFFNSFLSYLVLMLVIAAVAAVAVFIGITMRKKKDWEQAVQDAETEHEEGK